MKQIIKITILTFAINTIMAQDNIKKIIYDDLFALNDLYDGCLLQKEQKRILIGNGDTTSDFKKIEEIKDDFVSRVILIKIDSNNGYYFVEAKFDLIADISQNNLFLDNSFTYVLYKKNNKLLKINGFLISEILLTDTRIELIRNIIKIDASRRFDRYIRRRETDKIKDYLYISILKKVNFQGFKVSFRPYVKDVICY